MNKHCNADRQLLAATLMELSVVMAVLFVLAALIFQLTGEAQRAMRYSNRALDAMSQARLAFDRIGLDLAGRVSRPDTDFVVAPQDAVQPGDILKFVSTVGSASSVSSADNRGISVVGYRVARHPDNRDCACLLRAALPMGWSNSGAGFMGLKEDGFPVRLDAEDYPLKFSDANYDVLAPGIVRMVAGFQLYPDNKPVELLDGKIGKAEGQIVYSPPVRGKDDEPRYIDLTRVSSLVVGVAAVDVTSLGMLTPDQTDSLAASFIIQPQENTLPLAQWMTVTDNFTKLPADIPPPVRQAIRLFQRNYPITPYTTQ